MQNEWPHGRADGDDRTTEEITPESQPPSIDGRSHGEVDHGIWSTPPLPDPAGEAQEVAVPDTSPDDPASAGEGVDHRSAVDAVGELLDEVERSLARLDDGTYGRCDSCGAAIEDARLVESPVVRSCGDCVPGGSPVLVVAGAGPVDPAGTADASHHD